MKLIPIRWLAKVHYPSHVRYELELACTALENTLEALASCCHMKSELVFSSRSDAEKMLQVLEAMFTMLETREALLRVRISELRMRKTMVDAFNIQIDDRMPALDEAIKHIDKVFLDLADPQIHNGVI